MNNQARIDAALNIGGTAQTIAVSADAAQLQTDSANVHDDIGTKQLQDLPQATRTYQGLVGLVRGWLLPVPTLPGAAERTIRGVHSQ